MRRGLVIHCKLQGSLQGKDTDLASVSGSTTQRLKELKENTESSTWFNEHRSVFTNPSQLGARNIDLTESMKACFLQKVYRPYIQSVIGGRLGSTDLIASMSVFDPRVDEDRLSDYGRSRLCGCVQVVHFDVNEGVSILILKTPTLSGSFSDD